jgi:hypothetical protein
LFIGAFLLHTCFRQGQASPFASHAAHEIPKHRFPFPRKGDLIGFLVSQRLKRNWRALVTLVPIRPFLNGQTFDPETARLVGIAFEAARAAVNRPLDLTDEMIARTIIELAKAGERNVDALCEAALSAPTGAVSAPNPPPLPA